MLNKGILILESSRFSSRLLAVSYPLIEETDVFLISFISALMQTPEFFRYNVWLVGI